MGTTSKAAKMTNTMANPFVKAWKYLMALFDSKIEENADPKGQLVHGVKRLGHFGRQCEGRDSHLPLSRVNTVRPETHVNKATS